MGNRGKLKIWSHWFWITMISGWMIAPGSGTGLLVEPSEDIALASFPIEQRVERDMGDNTVVSKSVSVSKVSVKMGDVTEVSREDRSLPSLYDGLYSVASLPIVNERVTQPPESLLRHLLEQLQAVASVSVGSEADYQLVYKDEAEPDYYSDYGLSDEYLDYLYQIYDDLDNGITYYDTEYVDNDATQLVNRDQDDLSGAISISGEAEGRVLLEEDITEKQEQQHITEPEGQLFENVVPPVSDEVTAGTVVNKLEYVDKFLNISKIEETREDTTETTIEDFVVDVELLKTSTNNNSDIYIKIGIFITVSLAVLVMTGGLICVMMRRKIKTVAESSLVTNENESNSQVVFQRGLRTSTTSSLQEHFNNHFGKSGAAYLYDDLHSLDNDSFLTSLETISEKDRFNWE